MKLRHLRNCSTLVWKVTFALSLLLSIMFHPSALSFGIPRYLFLDQSFLSCTPNHSLSLLTVVTPFPTSHLVMITRLTHDATDVVDTRHVKHEAGTKDTVAITKICYTGLLIISGKVYKLQEVSHQEYRNVQFYV